MKTAVIVEGVRTPFAKAGDVFKDVSPQELGRVAVARLLDQSGCSPNLIEEVIFGNIGSPSDAANISRVIALRAGLSNGVSAYTVQRNCASALEAVAQAALKVEAGRATAIIAGGTESMSQIPVIYSARLKDALEGWMRARSLGEKWKILSHLKLQDLKPRIGLIEGLTDPFCGLNMGQTAEKLAREFAISRDDQDSFAISSHEKALAAIAKGVFKEESTPVFLPPNHDKAVDVDVGPRAGLTMEKMAKLKPIFDRKFGTVTVGNSCPITDGAAALLVMEEEKARAEGFRPLAKIRSYAFSGLEPERMGLGPVLATRQALQLAGLQLKDMQRVELNEAFSAQVLACVKAFSSKHFSQERFQTDTPLGDIPMEILNVNGGAIALGHPVGTTGARLVLTLAKEMARSQKQFGLATLCIGGGQGGAMILENVGA